MTLTMSPRAYHLAEIIDEEKVKLQKESAKANQLAVNRFEALLLHTKNLQYELQQRVVETENKLKFIMNLSS